MKFSLLTAIQVLEKKEQIMVPGAGLEPARPQRSGVFSPWHTTLLTFRYTTRNTNSSYLAILVTSGYVRPNSACHCNTLVWGGWELIADVIVMVTAQMHSEFKAASENGGDFGTDL